MSSPEIKVRLEQLMPLIREKLSAGQNVCFYPYGISMLPMLHQGVDTVTLSPLPAHLKKYDLPLYQRDNGRFVLHRIIDAGDTYTCCGDNQFSPEPGIRTEQMIAVVSAFTHRGKTISVRNPGYRLYCRLWCATRRLRWYARRIHRKIQTLTHAG